MAEGWARYVFGVSLRIEPASTGVTVDPDTVECRLYRRADPPGADGWLFFRDNLWRGELNDPEHFRSLVAEELGVTVTDVEFRSMETDEEYLNDLRAAIDADLDAFRADSPREAVHKYLGSSIQVRERPDGER